jgi:hypothetical protein
MEAMRLASHVRDKSLTGPPPVREGFALLSDTDLRVKNERPPSESDGGLEKAGASA